MESFNNKLKIVLLISLGAIGTYGVMSHRPTQEKVATEQVEEIEQNEEELKDKEDNLK